MATSESNVLDDNNQTIESIKVDSHISREKVSDAFEVYIESFNQIIKQVAGEKNRELLNTLKSENQMLFRSVKKANDKFEKKIISRLKSVCPIKTEIDLHCNQFSISSFS